MIRLPLFVVALTLLLSPVARADGPQAAAAATAAVEELTRYNDDVAKTNDRPAFAKPPASEFLARILDAQALASLPAPEAEDMPWLVKWSDAMNKVNHILIFAGAQSSSEADQRAAIERNMNDYEDVLFPAWAFMARMQDRLILTADLFMTSLPDDQRTPVRQRGLAQIRDGHIQFVQGGLTTIAAGVKPENAHLLTVALRETAPTWAPRIKADEQERLRSILAEAKKKYQDKIVLDDIAGLALMIEGTKPR
jgi:hypothetical protein